MQSFNRKGIRALAAFCVILLAVAAIGATVIGYQDWQLRGSAPASPGTGYYRTWADLTSGLVKCMNASGAACYFATNTVAPTLALGVNGTANGSQTYLNLVAGSNMTLTDNGTGSVTFASTAGGGGGGITLENNGAMNGSQTLLNLLSGSNISIADNGSGGITIASTGGSTRGIGMAFGSTAGSALTGGSTQFVTVPFACSIVGWNMTVDAGTATVDVWKIAAGPVDWSGTTGTVNTGGVNVTWLSGATFPADAAGRTITINSVQYVIQTVTSSTALTLTTSAGAQFGVAFASPGTAVPTVSNSIVASAYPAISSGTFAGSTSIGTWTTAVRKNDILGFDVKTVATAKALSIVLECEQ